MTTDNTEQRILDAAQQLFVERGFALTSTTDIARLAGCNQALVHYYFRTKENLLRRIYLQNATLLLQLVGDTLQSDMSFEQMVRSVIAAYFRLISEQPKLPYFIINEIINNAERRQYIRQHITAHFRFNDIARQFTMRLKEEHQAGRIINISPLDLVLHVVSLTVFTFISIPMYQEIFACDDAALQAYIARREEEITRFVLRGIAM